jgi:hypothetical protein
VRKPLTIVLVGVVAAGLVVGTALVGLHWWRDAHRTDLERAASYAPGDAERLSWTDWAAVRAAVRAGVDASSSAGQLQDFLDQGYDEDLTSASALVQSAPVLQSSFGFSPASALWELFSQSDHGAVVIVRVPDDLDFGAVGDRLEKAGFTRPSAEDGVWLGGDTLLPSIGENLTPELQYVALDAADHLVLTSDNEDYLRTTVEGLGKSELSSGMRAALSGSGEPLSAAIYDGPYTCKALAMSGADDADQLQADELVRDAGEVDPVTGFAMSVQPGGHVRVVLAFETDDQARANAGSRALLAGGPAPGQGGDFPDRFSVASSSAKGSLVTLDLVPRSGSYVFSDLSTGPLLFATC